MKKRIKQFLGLSLLVLTVDFILINTIGMKAHTYLYNLSFPLDCKKYAKLSPLAIIKNFENTSVYTKEEASFFLTKCGIKDAAPFIYLNLRYLNSDNPNPLDLLNLQISIEIPYAPYMVDYQLTYLLGLDDKLIFLNKLPKEQQEERFRTYWPSLLQKEFNLSLPVINVPSEYFHEYSGEASIQ